MPLENPGSSSVSFSSQQTELIQIFAKRTYPPQKLLSLMSISIFDKVTEKMNIIYIFLAQFNFFLFQKRTYLSKV